MSQSSCRSTGGAASRATKAAPSVQLGLQRPGRRRAAGGHSLGWLAVHAPCCFSARPTQGREQTTGLWERATEVFFGSKDTEHSLRPLRLGAPPARRSTRECSAWTSRPPDGPGEEQVHLRPVLLRVGWSRPGAWIFRLWKARLRPNPMLLHQADSSPCYPVLGCNGVNQHSVCPKVNQSHFSFTS